MKVLMYTRRGMTDWMRHVAASLKCASQTTIASELRNQGDVNLAQDFYRYMRAPGNAQYALGKFGDAGCFEIIARCRLLRSLDRQQALEMIGAMSQACANMLDKFQPNLFMATRIDSYVLDIIDRLLTERKLRFVGLWRAAVVPKMVFFTTRGEHIPLRQPQDAEISRAIAAITDPEFQATSLKKSAKFNFANYLKKRLYYSARDNFVDIQRWVERDPLGYRYLTSGKHVKEYRMRLSDWRVVNFMAEDWHEQFRATPFEKRVFIALQVNPESTIDYYVRNVEMLNCTAVLLKMINVLERGGYKVFVKDHPNMFGMRSARFYEALAAQGSVVFVPYEVSSNDLILQSKATFTWSGTVGLQAAMAGRCAVVVQPTYLVDGPFLQITTLEEINALADRIRDFSPPPDLNKTRVELARHVLSSFIPGSMNWQGFDRQNPEAIQETGPLIASLDRYLPEFAA